MSIGIGSRPQREARGIVPPEYPKPCINLAIPLIADYMKTNGQRQWEAVPSRAMPPELYGKLSAEQQQTWKTLSKAAKDAVAEAMISGRKFATALNDFEAGSWATETERAEGLEKGGGRRGIDGAGGKKGESAADLARKWKEEAEREEKRGSEFRPKGGNIRSGGLRTRDFESGGIIDKRPIRESVTVSEETLAKIMLLGENVIPDFDGFWQDVCPTSGVVTHPELERVGVGKEAEGPIKAFAFPQPYGGSRGAETDGEIVRRLEGIIVSEAFRYMILVRPAPKGTDFLTAEQATSLQKELFADEYAALWKCEQYCGAWIGRAREEMRSTGTAGGERMALAIHVFTRGMGRSGGVPSVQYVRTVGGEYRVVEKKKELMMQVDPEAERQVVFGGTWGRQKEIWDLLTNKGVTAHRAVSPSGDFNLVALLPEMEWEEREANVEYWMSEAHRRGVSAVVLKDFLLGGGEEMVVVTHQSMTAEEMLSWYGCLGSRLGARFWGTVARNRVYMVGVNPAIWEGAVAEMMREAGFRVFGRRGALLGRGVREEGRRRET